MPTFLDIFLKKALFKRVFEISTSEKKKNNKRKKQLKKRPSPFSVITQQKNDRKRTVPFRSLLRFKIV